MSCQEKCKAGLYGKNCNTTCRKCLNSTTCHHITESCDKGCDPGYEGLTCKKECKAGYYGGNCKKSCGHCLNEKACHHVNGMCGEECEPGYKAPYCTKVITATVTEKKMTSEFNGILSAFCVLLFVIGIVVAYFVVKRFRNLKVQNPAIYKSKVAEKGCESDVSNVYINDNDGSEYQ